MGNNSDREEVDRLLNALTPCRKCEHLKIAHSFMLPNKGKCVDATVKSDGEHKICNCKMFVPKDNLEFLEWVAENKQKENQ